jgi:hypothetical protein
MKENAAVWRLRSSASVRAQLKQLAEKLKIMAFLARSAFEPGEESILESAFLQNSRSLTRKTTRVREDKHAFFLSQSAAP